MKRILKIFIILLLLITIPVQAKTPETEDRNSLDNYGVNKKWEITSSNKSNVLSTHKVDASEKIYDFSDVLTEDEEKELKKLIDAFINEYNVDMAIVIDNLSYYNDSTNDVYASDFWDYNDFGIDDKHYSGILLFRNTYERDPYYDMYTFGESQLYFNQSRYDNILDGIYNDIHTEEYLSGFTSFINKVSRYYKDGIPNNMKNKYIDDNGRIKSAYRIPFLLSSIIGLISGGIGTGILCKKNKMVKLATEANEYLDKKSVNLTKDVDNFIRSYTSSYVVSHSSGSGGGSHFGSSGGGFSSGGGRHG